MLRSCTLAAAMAGLVALTALPSATAQPPSEAHAEPKLSVKPDDTKNGWTILSKYQSSDKYARTAQVSTLEAAKKAVEDIKKNTSSLEEGLKLAEVVVVGKDGDGKVADDDLPYLPDWAEVQNRLLALTPERSKELTDELKGLEPVYEDVQKAVEAAVKRRRLPTPAEVVTLQGLMDTYNRRRSDLEQKLYKSRPIPLPTFKPLPDPSDHITSWKADRGSQYQMERHASDLAVVTKELERDKAKILEDTRRVIFDDAAGVDPKQLDARKLAIEKDTEQYKQKRQAHAEKLGVLEKAQSETVGRLNAFQTAVLDSTAVIPPAGQFAGDKGGATYTSLPGVKVLKTGPTGDPLPDDEQPAGYPRTLAPGEKPAANEKRYVDPAIRVEFGTKAETAPVRAGVIGKVVRVDAARKAVEIQTSAFGERIIIENVEPGGVKESDYVNSGTVIGNVRRSGVGPPALRITAVDRRRQYLNPTRVIREGNAPTAAPDQLSRPGAAANPDDRLPTKDKAKLEGVDPDGKANGTWRVTFDDTTPKRKAGELSTYQLDFQEGAVRTGLERLKQQLDEATTRLSAAKQKKQEADANLAKANAALVRIDGDAKKLPEQTEAYKKGRKQLEDEFKQYMEMTAALDKKTATLKDSKDKKAVEEHKKAVEEHNAKAGGLTKKLAEVEKLNPDATIARLVREQEKALKDKTELERSLPELGANVSSAQTELDKVKAAAAAKEGELKTLAAQKEKLKAEEAAAEKEAKEAEKAAAEKEAKEPDPKKK